MRVIRDLPRGVIAGGRYYAVDTSFRTWLEFGAILEKGDPSDAVRALRLCYSKDIPPSPEQALSALVWFFLGGEEPRIGKEQSEAVFSFERDEELMYASFYAMYGIDLSAAQLHWWQFLALLRGLGADTPLMRTAAIRAANPADIKDASARRRLMLQKRAAALGGEHDAARALAQLF